MKEILILIALDVAYAQIGIQQVVSFNNKIIPHVLQALSYDKDNVVYSPFGLSTTLAVVLEGVDNNIATQVCKTLRLDDPKPTREAFRFGFKAILEQLSIKSTSSDFIGSSNIATVHSSVPLIPQFSQLLQTFYKAKIVDNITESSGLELDLTTETKLATHWKDYDKLVVYTYLSHQNSVPFTTSNGSTINVPMVPQIGLFKAGYLPKLNSQAVELPLQNDEVSLFLIMPDYRDGIRQVLIKMLDEDLAKLPNNLPTTETEVALPQFAIVSSDLDIGKILKGSGLGVIFLRKNSTKGRTQGPVRTIKQNGYFATSFVSLNGLVTTNSLLYKKLSHKKQESETEPEEKIEENDMEEETRRKKRQIEANFVFNRPFIFFVYAKQSRAILLAGVVKSPLQVPV